MKFILDNRVNHKKYDCPKCNHKRRFTRYIHSQTFEEINDDVGICDRKENCGYHFSPKDYFENNIHIDKNKFQWNNNIAPVKKETSYIKSSYMELSFKDRYSKCNSFYMFLKCSFGEYLSKNLINRYKVGNSSHWNGANVFWQIDIEQKIRTGKIMLYNPSNGKRVKQPYSHVDWVHRLLHKKNLVQSEFNLKQCFFGEHILKYETNEPIAIVESEKTAMVCYLFHPDYIWLACGSANGLNIEKCKVLKGRKVVLFPDVKQFDYWSKKAIEIHEALGINISVDDFLETKTPEAFKEEFSDLADYYLQDKNEQGKVMFDETQTLEEYLLKNRGNWIDSAP